MTITLTNWSTVDLTTQLECRTHHMKLPNANLHCYTDLKYAYSQWKYDSYNKWMVLQNNGNQEILNKLCYHCVTRWAIKFCNKRSHKIYKMLVIFRRKLFVGLHDVINLFILFREPIAKINQSDCSIAGYTVVSGLT